MFKTRQPKFIFPRFIYGAAGLLILALGLSAFVGVVVPSGHEARKDSSDSLTYLLAVICSLPFLAVGLAFWMRGRYWKREAERLSRREG
jgi:uncharacterized membrane protein